MAEINELSEIDELLKRVSSTEHDTDREYWEKLIADMKKFLSEDHPEEEKRELSPIGALEMAYMMLRAI